MLSLVYPEPVEGKYEWQIWLGLDIAFSHSASGAFFFSDRR
jgi:hypothetical protein